MATPSAAAGGSWALLSALCWGGGDFAGGLATRRAGPLAAAAVVHPVALLLLAGAAVAAGEPLPGPTALTWGLVAGAVGALSLAALYQALAVGAMGIAAPLTAVLMAAVPVVVGVIGGGPPAPRQGVGFGLALAGIWFLTRGGGGVGAARGVGMAVVAGVGFGLFLLLLERAGATSLLWPLAAARLAAVVLVAPVLLASALRRRARPPGHASGNGRTFGGAVALAALAALVDATGTVCFVLATRGGRVDVAAVLSSLYPAVTVMLARLFLGERLARTQLGGAVAALAAIPLIVGG